MDELVQKLKCFAKDVTNIDDPFFDEGNEVCRMYVRKGIIDEDEEDLCHQVFEKFKCGIPNCTQEFDTLLKYELHYNSCHRYSCSLCKKQLPSPHLLDLHVCEMHDSFFKAAAERKPMYKCYVETCNVISQNPQERRSHCIEVHKFPHDFRYDVKKTANKKKGKIHEEEQMDTSSLSESTEEQRKNISCSTTITTTNLDNIPTSSGPFTFGHKRTGKTFNSKKLKANSINMSELMESLPSEPVP